MSEHTTPAEELVIDGKFVKITDSDDSSFGFYGYLVCSGGKHPSDMIKIFIDTPQPSKEKILKDINEGIQGQIPVLNDLLKKNLSFVQRSLESYPEISLEEFQKELHIQQRKTMKESLECHPNLH